MGSKRGRVEQKAHRQYSTFITIPEGVDPEAVAEKARELGMAELALKVTYQAPDDWDLYEVLSDVQAEMAGMGVDFHIDKMRVQNAEPWFGND